MLVGDAAGLANAFYKEGIGTGMMSGIIAAKNIERCLNNDGFSESSLKKYDEDLKKEFGPQFTKRLDQAKRLAVGTLGEEFLNNTFLFFVDSL